MVVLIDTNVVLDYIETREPFYTAASEIMAACAEGRLDGCIAFHSVSNIWYLLRRIPERQRREILRNVCKTLTVAGAPHDAVLRAIDKDNFPDFEDCLQDMCAVNVKAAYIITRNTADFAGSEIPAISPEDFLRANA